MSVALRRSSLTIALLACATAIGGCVLKSLNPPVPAPTPKQIENATYSGILEQPITLEDGSYQGAPFVETGASRPAVQLWTDLIAYGDLDGTPGDEAVVLLSATSGGSGERIYVSTVGTRDGHASELGTVLIGDRVKVRHVTVSSGEVSLDVVEAGPDDPACCPTQLAHKIYGLEDGGLRLKSSAVQGTLSLETLSGYWELTWIDQEAPPQGAKRPTLEVRGNLLSGYSGCNRYSGSVEEKAPGRIKVSSLAGTRMACAPPSMNLEQDFLQRLEDADQYTFLAGRLALSGSRGDSEFLLVFESQPPPTKKSD